ncbi:class I SAM-dependent methyltransferase [Halothiobacillus sp.]|uniref:class I SAM-dependent methyltransferase n=1 Tax=Halothiobacillus sp. TaxID=1891311 RepID=UPI00260F321E|nr:class I SAM-dependent methyltransferase [Halothiobacillus sp.]
MSDLNFYRAFEDRHRGSRSLIKERLQVYVPFLVSLLKIYPQSPVIDLGCGRGEWLELVNEYGFVAYGVDMDDGMLASCHELGLHAENKDLIAALRDLPDESQTVVSAFHVVEHIPFETLMELVREAFRVLKPAGLLILETPNPENISVGTTNFYLDPTHERPIPPALLSFLPEYTGFYRTKVLRLQEPESLREKTDVVLMDVLAGVSPDYSVVAQKSGRQSEIDLFNPDFEFEYGLNLGNLASRYDASLATRFSEIESLSRSALTQANIAIEQAAHAEAQAAHANERANHAEAHAQVINQHYQAVVCSRSWKLTKSLRLAGKFARWFVRGSIAWLTFKPGSRPRRMIRSALIKTMATVQTRPRLKRFVLKVLNRFPRLKQRLWSIRFQNTPISLPIATPTIQPHEADLSPRARQIYLDLKTAMEKHNKEGV